MSGLAVFVVMETTSCVSAYSWDIECVRVHKWHACKLFVKMFHHSCSSGFGVSVQKDLLVHCVKLSLAIVAISCGFVPSMQNLNREIFNSLAFVQYWSFECGVIGVVVVGCVIDEIADFWVENNSPFSHHGIACSNLIALWKNIWWCVNTRADS